MKQTKQLTLHFTKDLNIFTDLEKSLITTAKQASQNAYAPFSKFYVGAALLLQDGKIISGSNQENASFPSGLCAERVALNSFGHLNGNQKIVSMAITARSEVYKLPDILSPCGGCLQVMAEFVKRQNCEFRIILFSGEKGYYYAEGVSTFLPFGFSLLK